MHKVKVIKVQGLVPYPETGDEKQNLQRYSSLGKFCASLLVMRDTDTGEKKKRADKT